MKLDLNKIYICIIIILFSGLIYQYFKTDNIKNNYDNQIKTLNIKNDSLISNVNKNNTKIKDLNYVILSYESEIEQKDLQLHNLKKISYINKLKYNEIIQITL